MPQTPESPEELAAQLAGPAAKKQTITLKGAGSKDRMAGPIAASDVTISTACLNRVLQYEPRDLTISVEAGMPWRELTRLLRDNRQMIPIDPPFAGSATVGGVVATNSSGPRRRLYGTARDVVIGMTFATLEGKLVKTGGMVVKNVAGLDMAKLMIGSFGTLAGIAIVNFRVHPMPHGTRTFFQEFLRPAEALAARDRVIQSTLTPAAIDILKTSDGYDLMVQAGGSAAVLDRYQRELASMRAIEGDEETRLWERIREYTPTFLDGHPNGAVLRVSSTLSEMAGVLESLPAPALARAGSGVTYGYFEDADKARAPKVGKRVLEFSPLDARPATLWPEPGSDFAMMKKVKELFDPAGLLNRGRLYGRI